jgi:quinol monooxygenase YgiN
MEDKKIYLWAELTIQFLEEVRAILKEALIPTLQEPGCEALYETGRKDDPHKVVFFEVSPLRQRMSSTSSRTIQSG